MATLYSCSLLLLLLVLSSSLASVTARAQSTTEPGEADNAPSAAITSAEESEGEAAVEEEETAVELEVGGKKPGQYPFRDLPADVLRDFPGLCFGSTALRLFQVGQSWSLAPFCGVATCLVSRDGYHLVERVQDCGPQPKRNDRCRNINVRSEEAFPNCCPSFECEEGVELEYPTQDELQQLAHEAAQAAVRAQYEDTDEDGVEQTGRIAGSQVDDEDLVDVESPMEVDLETAPPAADDVAADADDVVGDADADVEIAPEVTETETESQSTTEGSL